MTAPTMHRAFVPSNLVQRPGVMVRSLFNCRVTPGDIGIEIECEGNKFKKQYLPEPWRYEHDGSLRGADNAEYIFKTPQKFEDVPAAVNKLWAMFEEFGTVLDDSNRTSVHVHLNVQGFHLNRLCSLMGLYVAVEEVLTMWCGDHRVGNLFCLRCKDAPAIVSKMKKFFQQDNDSTQVLTEGLHYAGMNAHAMMKYGSLEIRSLRGVTDPDIIIDWVAILRRIYDLSAEYPDPRSITENFSGGGPIEFLRMVLGDKYDVVRDNIEISDDQLRQVLTDGIRLAQDLCYCRDWSQYKPADVSKDPFGRNSKHTQSSFEQFLAQQQQAILSTNAFHTEYVTMPMAMPYPAISSPSIEVEDFEEEFEDMSEFYDEDEE